MATQLTQLTQRTQDEGEGTQAAALGPTTYTIQGVKVEFPTKAYPSQVAMMNKVIQGLKMNKNCLLESPTGSGKTLALLCAALAWQRHEHERVSKYNEELAAREETMLQNMRQQQRKQPKQTEVAVQEKPVAREKEEGPAVGNTSVVKAEDEEYVDLGSDEDEFKANSSRSSLSTSVLSSSVITEDELSSKRPQSAAANLNIREEQPYFVPPEKKLTVPKIFFGTRTHKQIAQVTRELRKTFYKTVRSVVLASRDHTCINPLLENLPNKNEQCKELLDNAAYGEGCSFHSNARKLGNFNSLENYGVLPGYDLEDLVKAGRQAKSCPYYATRLLMTNADIIFCPYNYIIDPNIRRSMNLELENQVIIFDEAHNMEDAARDAASFTLKQHEVTRAMQDCEKVKLHGGAEPKALQKTALLLSQFSGWIDTQSQGLKDVSLNSAVRSWTGTEAIASLHTAGLDEEMVKESEECFKMILAQREKDMELMRERGLRYSTEKPSIPSASIAVIENVFRLFQDMYKNNGLNRDDFRIALVKSTEKRRRDGHTGMFMSFLTHSIHVWCLNPAVAFAEIKNVVHNIVLTSGTLSPMQSFQSELGTPFPLTLEASHVIDKNQVWAGVLGVGPSGVNLNGTYQNSESLSYQDEVGKVVQYVCDTMPYGVLCFFPSYSKLEKMVERWQITKQYDTLLSKKHILIEPRGGTGEFEKAMNSYYSVISGCDGEEGSGVTGALFLAVCRGKVSEGLDFSDNNARAVICIGIPFPNFKDKQVELKRDYNQKNIRRGLLPGHEWYEIQAFRALNQALGRCIRHRQDWGAILLIDDRYIKTPRYIQSLSRWIRSSVKHFERFSPVPDSLECFRDEMLARPVPTEPSFVTQKYDGYSFLPLTRRENKGWRDEADGGFSMSKDDEENSINSSAQYTTMPAHPEDEDDSLDSSDFDPSMKASGNSIFNRGTQSGNSQKPRGIEALFARQRENKRPRMKVKEGSETTQQEKKIKL